MISDDYRRTVYQMEAADLKVRLNRAGEAVADLERLLAKLNPESWLFREVRRKIEDVYLRTDDQDGLAKYYAAWLAKNSEDIEAMARLARVLARQSRVPEARQWLDKALKLRPRAKTCDWRLSNNWSMTSATPRPVHNMPSSTRPSRTIPIISAIGAS